MASEYSQSFSQFMGGNKPTAPSNGSGYKESLNSFMKSNPVAKPTPTPTKAPTPTPTKAPVLSTQQKAVSGAQSVVKKISDTISFAFTKPKIVSPIPTDKPITPAPGKPVVSKPVVLEPGQKKLTQNQLQEMFPQTTQAVGDLMSPGKTDIKKAGIDAWNVLKEAFTEGVKRTTERNFSKSTSQAEKVSKELKYYTGVANAAFAPVGAVFAALNNSNARSLTKAIAVPFVFAAEGATKISDATFDALPIDQKTKDLLKPAFAEVSALAAQFALGKLVHVSTKKATGTISKVGGATFEKFTKNVIEESGLPRTINVTKEQARNVLRNLGDKEVVDLFKTLDIRDKLRAVKEGGVFEVAAEKIVRVVDKPYWGKIKSIFNRVVSAEPTNKTTITKGDVTRTGDSFGGLLEAGEKTPQEIIDTVMSSGLEKTPEGKAMLQSAIEAQQKGQNIMVTNATDIVEPKVSTPTGSVDPLIEEAKGKSLDEFIEAQELPQVLRGTKGLTADDIMKTYPNIKLTKDIPATDIYGKKVVIPDGEKLTPYELKGNKILLQDGETYIVTKNQFQNIKGNSIGGEPKPFAPELKGTEESINGGREESVNEAAQIVQKHGNAVNVLDRIAEGKSLADLNEFATKPYTQAEFDQLKAIEARLRTQRTVKYSNYTLPDGKNYREVLIKAPVEKGENRMSEWVKSSNGDLNATFNGKDITITPEGSKFYVYEKGGRLGQSLNTIEEAKKVAQDYGVKNIKNPNAFKSSHWDEPNVISHLRLNERTYNGKKVTFMEELQSDWAREGRSKGFSGESALYDNYLAELKTKYNENNTGKLIEKITDVEDAKLDSLAIKEGVPNNPLLKNWQILTIKRALLDAVNSDAQYFSWINGEQTSARYNLATYVENVGWKPQGELKLITIISNKGSGQMGSKFDLLIDKEGTLVAGYGDTIKKGQKIDEVLGKGLADKVMEKETGTLSGEGLKFGGEWASNLYDKQVKVIVEDLTGGKVETIDMKLPIEEKDAPEFIDPETEKVIEIADLKVGKEIAVEGDIMNGEEGDSYIITDVLGDGKFKATPKEWMDEKRTAEHIKLQDDFDAGRTRVMGRPTFEQTFDISQKTTTQQAIKLTPDIKARIRGEAPEIKTSGKQFEDTRAKLTDIWNKANENKKTSIEEEADQSLLMSELAKQEAIKETPQSKKVVAELTEKQQAIEQAKQENQVKKSILDQFNTPTIRAMRAIKKSVVALENKGLDPTNVSTSQSYKDHIEDVMAALKTTSEDVALDYIRNELPDALTSASTREQLQEIRVLKSRIEPKEVPVNRSQLPVGEGKLQVSRLEARVKGQLNNITNDTKERIIEEFGLSVYNRMNIKENIAKAAEYVINNEKDALDVLRGSIQPPEGIHPESIYIAMLENSKSDLTLATKLASLQATSLGQRLRLLGEIDPNSPVKILNEVYKVREELFKKKYKNQTVKQVREKVVKQIKEKVKRPDKYDWNSFIKSLEC